MQVLDTWAVNLPYLVGSLAFLVGGWVQMRMWKAQQFGLGFIREVNDIFKAFAKPIDWRQQVFMAIYTTTAALCALNLALNYGWHASLRKEEAAMAADHPAAAAAARTALPAHDELLHWSQLLTDLTGWVASHGMLMLATVVHQTPDIHPFDYLLWVMRLTSVCLLGSAALRCARYLEHEVASVAVGP